MKQTKVFLTTLIAVGAFLFVGQLNAAELQTASSSLVDYVADNGGMTETCADGCQCGKDCGCGCAEGKKCDCKEKGCNCKGNCDCKKGNCGCKGGADKAPPKK